MSKVENGVIWFTDDFDFNRTGIRLWDEIEGHVDIVYEEYDTDLKVWKVVSVISAIPAEMFEKLFDVGKFLLEMQRKDS
ncbi:hypothetical protein [Robertmurraya sp.]|uniref:hypothetical protein n=1 Tax=Robertmurraya sp. TaxID=2837525 RepID=UPI0037038762